MACLIPGCKCSEAQPVTPRPAQGAISLPEIDRRFDYHAPSGIAKSMHDRLRTESKSFAGFLLGLPEGREKSLAYTAFEEATFWAHAAIARDPSLHEQAD